MHTSTLTLARHLPPKCHANRGGKLCNFGTADREAFRAPYSRTVHTYRITLHWPDEYLKSSWLLLVMYSSTWHALSVWPLAPFLECTMGANTCHVVSERILDNHGAHWHALSAVPVQCLCKVHAHGTNITAWHSFNISKFCLRHY